MFRYIIQNIIDVIKSNNPSDGIFKDERNKTTDGIYYNVFFNEWMYR